MTVLFSSRDLKSMKSKSRSPEPDDRRRVLPTGSPRLVESSIARRVKADAEQWTSLLEAVCRGCVARLDLMKDRHGTERISCPWERLTDCDLSCRCGGCGTVTVEFLRGHYRTLVTEIEKLVRPAKRHPAEIEESARPGRSS